MKLTNQKAISLLTILSNKAMFNKMDTTGKRRMIRLLRSLRETGRKWQEFIKDTTDKLSKEEADEVLRAEFGAEIEVDAELLDTAQVDALIESNPQWDIDTADFIDETLTAPQPDKADTPAPTE